VSEEIHFRDFTRKRKPVRFKIDDDVFVCVPALGTEDIQELVTVFRGTQSDDDSESDEVGKTAVVIGKIREAFRLFLLPDSYEVFVHRLGDRKNPIDPLQLLEIVQWIVAIYTKRPTEPSPTSSTGSEIDDGGTDSTAGAQPKELDLSNLTLFDS
jgi:hypothetical protein